MKISMYMIEQWVRQFDPVSIIVDGDMELEGVRMFSTSTPPSTRYVYVARKSDFFRMRDTNEVLLIHRNDVIYLSTEDIEDVFNQIVGAFEYYRNLEYRLALALHLEQPEQKIIDLCAEEFGVAYIMSRKYHILAISAPKGEGDYSAIWKSLRETRLVPMDRLKKMSGVGFYKNINRKVHNLVFPSEMTSPYYHGVMNSYCDGEGKIIGQCMIAFDREIGKADLQLVDVFMEYMHSIENKAEVANGNYITEMLFDELIHGRSYQAEDLLKVTEIQQWSEDPQFCLFSSEIANASAVKAYDSAHMLTGLQQNIYRRHPRSVCIISHNQLICCIPVKTAKVEELTACVSKLVPEIREGENLRTGISYTFSDFTDAPYYYEQAQAALQHARAQNIPCASIHSCAMSTCVLHPNREFIVRCQHPLVRILKETDNRGNTEYYKTLKLFLRFERSYVEVAKELNVHRNTIVYRIDRIQELYPILNLGDPDEREYLLYSFCVDTQYKRRRCEK